MTREEAIIILKDCELNPCVPKDKEAADMAIKALNQEPCEDAISRHVVKEQMIKYGFNAPDMTVTEFVENLPPITPQTRWIPVSERLPKDNASYLVTVKQGYIMIGIWCGNPEYWENVVAWMPLPEPYKESEV